MARKDSKVIRLRNTIILFVSVVVIGILGFGTYVSTPLSKGEITAEDDYREVDNPRTRRAGEPIEVVEFFSYLCVHCMNFEPALEDWREDLPEDVSFARMPATFSPIQAVASQTYLALEAAGALDANHNRIFRAIHEGRRQFLTPEMFADYVDGRDVNRDEFLEHYDSPRVARALQRANRLQQSYGIRATPSLVVDGRYVVGMEGGQGRALEVVDHLLEKIRAEAHASAPSA